MKKRFYFTVFYFIYIGLLLVFYFDMWSVKNYYLLVIPPLLLYWVLEYINEIRSQPYSKQYYIQALLEVLSGSLSISEYNDLYVYINNKILLESTNIKLILPEVSTYIKKSNFQQKDKLISFLENQNISSLIDKTINQNINKNSDKKIFYSYERLNYEYLKLDKTIFTNFYTNRYKLFSLIWLFVYLFLLCRLRYNNYLIIIDIIIFWILNIIHTKSYEIDNDIWYIVIWGIELLLTVTMPIYNLNIFTEVIPIILISTKMFVCVFYGMKPLKRIYKKNIKSKDKSMEKRILNIQALKISHTLKNPILWFCLFVLIFSNVFLYSFIFYCTSGKELFIDCIIASINNYFAGSNSLLDKCTELPIQIASTCQIILAFFTNTLFITNIIEKIFDYEYKEI